MGCGWSDVSFRWYCGAGALVVGHQEPVWCTGVSPFVRKVRTASGATAVQIVSKSGGVRRIVEHLGSAHTEVGLEVLLEAGRQKIAAWRGQGMNRPGFCGGWFVWCRWLPVVIVPGGGCRVPRRLRARWGFACRWRSVAGWCPYQWTHSAVASTGGVDSPPKGPGYGISSALYKEFRASARAKPKGGRPWNPPRRPPRSRTGPAL